MIPSPIIQPPRWVRPEALLAACVIATGIAGLSPATVEPVNVTPPATIPSARGALAHKP